MMYFISKVMVMATNSLSHIPEADKARHPSLRRYTCKYRKKKKIVRDLWVVSGLVMLCVPLTFMLAMALGTTMLAFVILDETP
jgi:hypothetical protein